MAGALTGNIAVMQSILGEITDDTNQAREVTWSVGCVLGPIIGGYLSHPAERYPAIFGDVEFLARHPFFLPCFVSSSITLCSVIVAFVFLEETLPGKLAARTTHLKTIPRANNPQELDSGTTGQGTHILNIVSHPSVMELLSSQRIRSVIVAGFFLWFLSISWDAVFVLFAYTPARLGGLQRTPAEIGVFLATLGALGIFMALIAFPLLQYRFGTLRLHQACMALWPLMFMLFSVTSLFARQALGPSARIGDSVAHACMWVGLSLILLTDKVATMAYATNVIIVKSVAPNQASLGATFGLSMSVACSARAVAPAFVSYVCCVFENSGDI
ncbi:hypothetical protein FRB96_008871 [Tulasnella sp. 330]|nr:hypothetical protein FRB96_008871 [Tulasnella sp. 330]